MTTATGPENVNPIEAENTNPEMHESADAREALTDRVVVSNGEPCPDEPHIHADTDEVGGEERQSFGEFLQGLFAHAAKDMEKQVEEELISWKSAEALRSAVLNYKMAQEFLSMIQKDIRPSSVDADFELAHATTLVDGYQTQAKLALEIRQQLIVEEFDKEISAAQ